MPYATAKQISNGLLGWVDESPSPLNEAGVIQSGVNLLGGVTGDYIFQTLTETQALAIRAAMPARSKLVDGNLTSFTPITATLSAATLAADGVAEISLTVNVHDGNYNGAVKVTVTAPNGSSVVENLTATAGVASDVISTAIEGVHQVSIETVLHGLAFTSFEGV